eukprot:sb/3470718/
MTTSGDVRIGRGFDFKVGGRMEDSTFEREHTLLEELELARREAEESEKYNELHGIHRGGGGATKSALFEFADGSTLGVGVGSPKALSREASLLSFNKDGDLFRNILQHSSVSSPTSSRHGQDVHPQTSSSAPQRGRRTGLGNLEVAAHGTLGRRGSLDGICEESEENGESSRYSNSEKTILEQISEEVLTEESELEDEE